MGEAQAEDLSTFFPRHVDYQWQKYNSVLKYNNTDGFPSAVHLKMKYYHQTGVTRLASRIQVSNCACWFHLCEPSSSFLVGPPGPTGPAGNAGTFYVQYTFGGYLKSTDALSQGKEYWLYPGFGGRYVTGAAPFTISNTEKPPVSSIPFTTARTIYKPGAPAGTTQVSYTINNSTLGNLGLGVDGARMPAAGFRLRVYAYCNTDASGTPLTQANLYTRTATVTGGISIVHQLI